MGAPTWVFTIAAVVVSLAMVIISSTLVIISLATSSDSLLVQFQKGLPNQKTGFQILDADWLIQNESLIIGLGNKHGTRLKNPHLSPGARQVKTYK